MSVLCTSEAFLTHHLLLLSCRETDTAPHRTDEESRPRVRVCQLLATKASYLLSRRSSPAAYGKGCDRPQPPTTLENKRTMQTRPYSGSMREEGVFIICHRARKRCQGKPKTPWSLEDVQTSGGGSYAGVPKGARNLHSSTVRH